MEQYPNSNGWFIVRSNTVAGGPFSTLDDARANLAYLHDPTEDPLEIEYGSVNTDGTFRR